MKSTASNTAGTGRGNSKHAGLKAGLPSLAILIVVSMAGVSGLAADQTNKKAAKRLAITVRVYTYADVLPDDLAAAERVASRIYHQTGVELTWVNCLPASEEAQQNPSCEGPNRPTEIFMRIIPEFWESAHFPPSTMGYAIPTPAPNRGYLAGISLQRVKDQLPEAQALTLGELLGHGIAHEIGHLLLGSNSHSSSGLMSARWNARELRLAARAQLNFTGQQEKAIRADVQGRWRDQASRPNATMAQVRAGGPSATAPR